MSRPWRYILLGFTVCTTGCLDFGRPIKLAQDAEMTAPEMGVPVDVGMDAGDLGSMPDDADMVAPEPDASDEGVELDMEPDTAPDVALEADAAAEDGFVPLPYMPSTPHENNVTCISSTSPPCNGCPEGTVVPVGWVCIPAGRYVIGAGPEKLTGANDAVRMGVYDLPLPFLIQAKEMTQGEWERYLPRAANPSYGAALGLCARADCPVERINLYEAIFAAEAVDRDSGRPGSCYPNLEAQGTFADGCPPLNDPDCQRGTEDGGYLVTYSPSCGCDNVRLPTASEWEIAARAGSRSSTWIADANVPFGESVWHAENTDGPAQTAGLTIPNGFGLYDVLGNVAEWVVELVPRDEQWIRDRHRSATRGGSYLDNLDPPSPLRSASQVLRDNRLRSSAIGVRLVRTLYPPGTDRCLCRDTCDAGEDCIDTRCVSTAGTPCEEDQECGNNGRCVDAVCQPDE
jgi:formylglycine-generating enzyme required for sulfatase activity